MTEIEVHNIFDGCQTPLLSEMKAAAAALLRSCGTAMLTFHHKKSGSAAILAREPLDGAYTKLDMSN